MENEFFAIQFLTVVETDNKTFSQVLNHKHYVNFTVIKI